MMKINTGFIFLRIIKSFYTFMEEFRNGEIITIFFLLHEILRVYLF